MSKIIILINFFLIISFPVNILTTCTQYQNNCDQCDANGKCSYGVMTSD